MLPFAPHVKILQDISGTPLSIVDDSNYGTNSDSIDDSDIVTRVITILDKDDNLLETINMVQDTPAPYPITKDGFFRFHLVFSTVVPVAYTADVKFLSTRYYNNLQLNLAPLLRCACPNQKILDKCNKATDLYNAAVDAFMVGDDINAYANITDANTYLNQPC